MLFSHHLPLSPHLQISPTPQLSGLSLCPRKRKQFRGLRLSAAGAMCFILSPPPLAPNPSVTRDRRPQGGSRAPRRPAEDGAVDRYPSALPRGRVAGTVGGRGEARWWAPAPDHPPSPSGRPHGGAAG